MKVQSSAQSTLRGPLPVACMPYSSALRVHALFHVHRPSDKCAVPEEESYGPIEEWSDSNGRPRQVAAGHFAADKATCVTTATGCVYTGRGREGSGKALKVCKRWG